MTLYRAHDWLALAMPRKPVCRRCCATQRAMDYVRHQWVVAGIDRN